MVERFRVEWSPSALQDFDDLLTFVAARESPRAAARLGRTLLRRIEALDRLPGRGRVVPELKALGVNEYREIVASPYRLVYRVDGPVVGIVAVLDGRRELEELLIERVGFHAK